MLYKGFGLGHFAYMLFAFLITALLPILLKHRPMRTKIITGIVLSVILAAMYIVRISYIVTVIGANFKFHLPLHMCSIAILLMPIAAITRSKAVCTFLYMINLPGAIVAIVVPQVWFYDYSLKVFDYLVVAYYVEHALIVALSLYFVLTGLSEINKKAIANCAIFTGLFYVIMIFVNQIFGTYYMYTGITENPLAFLYFNFSTFSFTVFDQKFELNPLYYLIIIAIATVLMTVMYFIYRFLIADAGQKSKAISSVR